MTKPGYEYLRNKYGTEIESQFIAKIEDGEWPHFEWRVTLKRDGKVYTLPYKMGLGHIQTPCKKRIQKGGRYVDRPCTHVRCEGREVPIPPDLYTVFCSLKSDATRGATFQEWCFDYGYDTDSRKAMDTYIACQESENECQKFFGAEWSRLLEDEEYQ
jgi:hypothetical protein